MRRRCGLALPVLFGVFLIRGAAAGAPTATDQRALAEALFQAGREAIEAGRIEEACAKFAESQRVAPAGGTLLNLAICHEQQGLLASALLEFQQSVALARRYGRKDRLDIAQQHINTLAPRIPSVRINVPVASQRAGLVVRRGNVIVSPEAWGIDIPADPGDQIVTAQAPNCLPWQQSISLHPGDHRVVDVPALRLLPPAPRQDPAPRPLEVRPTPQPAPPSSPHALRTTAWVTGAVGIGLLGAGAYYGLHALSKRQASDAECTDGCTHEGVQSNIEAQRAATRSNVLLGGGVIATGLSAFVLLWTSPAPDTSETRTGRLHIDGSVAPDSMTISASGVF